MSIWLTVTLILAVLLAIGLFLAAQYQAHHADISAQRRFYELLEHKTVDLPMEKGWVINVVRRMAHSRVLAWMPKIEKPETILLLKQAGWYTLTGRAMYYMSCWVVPGVFVLVTMVYVLASSNFSKMAIAQLFMAGAFGFLMPKNILRRFAKSRREKLSREMPTAVHLLRMLFDAGLSTEHALRVLNTEGRLLTPELSKELTVALRQVDAGLDPADALSEMAAPLEVSELNDTVAIVKQVSKHGGNIRETLVKFAALMEDRQLSALREQVNILSGKMSIVMMVFLFPALLIFLAGPGFIALAKGLTGAF
ncbi:type II secretion system F family protein [Methylophaga sp. OBS3]|uniref:type II secretion system F family protein n=1 Tax=Methylophaga sp. OBS3 TaxID=2991934 RepID=UPI002258002D|nr:type II secretion system F family protein [Methylophaga sp. OBS3]MCX4189647.1 type II secretion system F family protein [Methylophaga sp. OBS3]